MLYLGGALFLGRCVGCRLDGVFLGRAPRFFGNSHQAQCNAYARDGREPSAK